MLFSALLTSIWIRLCVCSLDLCSLFSLLISSLLPTIAVIWIWKWPYYQNYAHQRGLHSCIDEVQTECGSEQTIYPDCSLNAVLDRGMWTDASWWPYVIPLQSHIQELHKGSMKHEFTFLHQARHSVNNWDKWSDTKNQCPLIPRFCSYFLFRCLCSTFIIIRFQYINQLRGSLIDDNYFAVALPLLFHSFFRLDFSLSLSIHLSIYRSPSFSLTLCVTHLLSLSIPPYGYF